MIRVTLVDPRPLVRAAYGDALGGAEIAIVDEGDNAEVAILAGLPDAELRSRARALKRVAPASAILLIGPTVGSDPVADLAAGAAARVADTDDPALLVPLVRRLAAGECPLADILAADPELARRSLDELRRLALLAPEPEPVLAPLTRRELEVLAAAASGASSRSIAGRLGISERTVEHHLASARARLGADDRTGAVIAALRADWIRLPRERGADGS